MTRREWNTSDGWECAAGWDRPLQHYFIDISKECGGCDGEGTVTDGFGGTPEDPRDCTTCDGRGVEFLFNNLEDVTQHTDAMGGMTMDQVVWVLETYLTAYPEGLVGMLMADKVQDLGNDIKKLGTVGEEKIRLEA